MIKLDPIIGVKDVVASSLWYQNVFGCKSIHGGNEFDVLSTLDEEVLICLHKWGEHEHPTMTGSKTTAGNGLVLYFRTDNMEGIRENVRRNGYLVELEIQVNQNSGKREFSLKDLDGYYLTIGEYHNYMT